MVCLTQISLGCQQESKKKENERIPSNWQCLILDLNTNDYPIFMCLQSLFAFCCYLANKTKFSVRKKRKFLHSFFRISLVSLGFSKEIFISWNGKKITMKKTSKLFQTWIILYMIKKQTMNKQSTFSNYFWSSVARFFPCTVPTRLLTFNLSSPGNIYFADILFVFVFFFDCWIFL
jgi:hypothetical protein